MGVDIAKLTGAFAAVLSGGDPDIGGQAGGNAAEHNAFWLVIIPIILVAMEVGDKALTAYDAYNLAQAAIGCNNGRPSACEEAHALAVDAGVDIGIELTAGSFVPGSKILGDLLGYVTRHTDANTAERIEDLVQQNNDQAVNDGNGPNGGGNGPNGGDTPDTIGGTICVYHCVIDGRTRYVGITNDVERRGDEHLRQKGIEIDRIEGLENLTRDDARAVEQTLIHVYGLSKDGGLMNVINSISPVRNPSAYEQALLRGKELLDQAGYIWTN